MEGGTQTSGSRRRGMWIAGIASILVLAIVGSFYGYGWWTRRGGVEYSRGGTNFLDAEQLTEAPPTAPEVPGKLASERPTSGPAPKLAPPERVGAATAAPTGTPRVSASAAPGKAPGKAAPVATAKPAAVAVQRPATGVYKLAVSGREGVKFGPLSFCDRKLPGESSLVVAPAQGEPDGSYTFDLRYYPGQPAQHDERQILRYGKDAVALAFEVGTVTCSGIRQSSEVSYEPLVDRVRFPIEVGASWTGKAGNDKRMESYTTKVDRKDVVRVAGRPYPVYVVESSATFTGAETGERRRVWWFSPELGVPLRWTDYVKGGRSGAAFSNDVSVEVTDLPKAPAGPRREPATAPAMLMAGDTRQRSMR